MKAACDHSVFERKIIESIMEIILTQEITAFLYFFHRSWISWEISEF